MASRLHLTEGTMDRMMSDPYERTLDEITHDLAMLASDEGVCLNPDCTDNDCDGTCDSDDDDEDDDADDDGWDDDEEGDDDDDA